MTPTVHLSCFLALLVASLAQGIKGSLRSQDPGPRPLELKEVFALFQTQYNRSYLNPAEHARRLNIFAHNLARAQQQQEEDLGTAKFGVTPFSDLTERDPEDQRSGCLSQIAESTDKYSGEEEFGQLYGHPVAAGRAPNMDRKVGSDEWSESVPPTCDWRKKSGVISSVKDQKNCNCCWAMAAAGNIEALWGIKHHQPVEVSVQELVDCTRCGNGCEGGFIWDAFITVLNNSGLASEKDYPYQGKVRTHKCQAKKHKNVAWIQDFIMLPDCEMKIARYLATEGPITVTINMKLLQQYQTGVIKATSNTCDPRLVDHSVLLVGFGKSKSVEGKWAEAVSSKSRHSIPYWILKNSWGASWGEKGYFRLHRGSNTCGITKYPLTARVTHPVKRKQQLVSCPP